MADTPKRPQGKPVQAKPAQPKPALPTELAAPAQFSDDPNKTVVLRAQDSTRNELVDKMLDAEQARADEKKKASQRIAMPEPSAKPASQRIQMPPKPAPTPPSIPRPSGVIPKPAALPPSASQRISAAPTQSSTKVLNPITALDMFYATVKESVESLVLEQFRSKPDWNLVLPEAIKENEQYRDIVAKRLADHHKLYEAIKTFLAGAASYKARAEGADTKIQNLQNGPGADSYRKLTQQQEEIDAVKAALKAQSDSLQAQSASLQERIDHVTKQEQIIQKAFTEAEAKLSDASDAERIARMGIEEVKRDQAVLAEEHKAIRGEYDKIAEQREAIAKDREALAAAPAADPAQKSALDEIAKQLDAQSTQLKQERAQLDQMVLSYQQDEAKLAERTVDVDAKYKDLAGKYAELERREKLLSDGQKEYVKNTVEFSRQHSDLSKQAAESGKSREELVKSREEITQQKQEMYNLLAKLVGGVKNAYSRIDDKNRKIHTIIEIAAREMDDIVHQEQGQSDEKSLLNQLDQMLEYFAKPDAPKPNA